MLFILLVYVLFGLVNGCIVADGFKGRFTWPASGIAAFAAANLVAAFFAWILARSSKPKEAGGYKYGLSAGGWAIGLFMAYAVGLVAGIFVA